MRLYTFVNYYLSPLQHGLQTAHITSELANQVAAHKDEDLESYRTYFDWAENHKTIIICKGGNHAMLEELFLDFQQLVKFDPTTLPLAKFNEDDQSLNGACTAVGLIVPEKYYDVEFTRPGEGIEACYTYFQAAGFCGATVYPAGSPEYDFIFKLKSFNLA